MKTCTCSLSSIFRFAACLLALNAVPNLPAEALDNWHWRNPTPTANRLSAVAYGNGLFVAVGDQATIQTSPDGVNWTLRHSGVSSLSAVAFGNGRFVVVGTDGSILNSQDGVNWSNGITPSSPSFTGVAYGNGAFVAVSLDGGLLISSNGVNWIDGGSLPSILRAITFGNGRFVIASSPPSTVFSQNFDFVTAPNLPSGWTTSLTGAGTAWRTSTDSSDTSPNSVFAPDPSTIGDNQLTSPVIPIVTPSAQLSFAHSYLTGDFGDYCALEISLNGGVFADIHAQGGSFVANGYSGLGWSGNSFGWLQTLVNLPVAAAGQTIQLRWRLKSNAALGGPGWHVDTIAVRESIGRIYTSTDLMSWTVAYNTDDTLNAVAYGNNTFVAVGAAGKIVTSSDGLNWSPRISGNTSSLSTVAYGNGTFVVSTDYGAILVSNDGINWTSVGLPAGNSPLHGMTFGQGLFVAVGDSGVAFTASSPANINNWRNQTSLTTQLLIGAAYGNGVFVAVSQAGAILRSTGGTNWTLQGTGGGNSLAGVAYGAGKFVAVGSSGTILVSPDGVTWATNSVDVNITLGVVAYGGGRFVASGSDLDPMTALSTPVVLTSTDAVSWTKHVLNISSPLMSIAYGNGRFAGVLGNTAFGSPYSGKVLVSTDGATWTCYEAGQIRSLSCIAFGNNTFVVLGLADTVGAVGLSPDGINWFTEQSDATASSVALAYGAGAFVAVGSSGIVTSADGLDWTNRFVGPLLYGIAAGNGTFVAVGDQGAILQSDVVGGPGAGPLIVVQQPQSLLRLVGETAGFGVGVSGAAPLQYQWQKNGVAISGATNRILLLTNVQTSDSGVYRAVILNPAGSATSQVAGLVVVARDPLDFWHLRDAGISLLPDPTLNAVAYGNGTFVAMGNGGLLLTSSNGVSWSRHPLSLGASGNALAFGNGTFVALGNTDLGCARVLVSQDGITWVVADPFNSHSTPACLGAVQALTFGGGKFVAVGSGMIAVSSNGATWTPSIYDVDLGLRSIAYGNGLFVAVGVSGIDAGNVILTSSDGLAWTYASYDQDPLFPLSGELRHVAFGNGRFVISGISQHTLVSEDGINWDAFNLPGFYTLDVITFGNGLFVAPLDPISGFLTSPDGVAWSPHQLNLDNFFGGSVRDMTYSQNTFIAVGSGGLILQSDPGNPAAPNIVRQPRNRAVPMGGTATLTVLATGSSPLIYDWYKDGALLCASNGPSLTFDLAQLSQAGSYQVVVRNPYGSVASSAATLTVEPAQPILSLRYGPSAQLTILGCIGCNYRIDSQDNYSSDSLAPWRTRTFLTLPATPYTWTDPESPFFSRRFYRVFRTDGP